MSYSRRQLYALGETLGDSATVKKVGGGRVFGDGGGGGGSPAPAGPTNTTVQNTNIPDYAQPYVSNMLNAAQAQIYNPDMTGFNSYTPYSNNPTDYIASFSPLQQQAQSGAANLQTPAQYQQGQNMTSLAGMGTMNLAGQEAKTGQNFLQNASNPGMVAQMMNPFIQAQLQPQLQEMQRQYGITGAQEMGNATMAHAFGGSREALMAAENERNKNMAMNQAIGTGYSNAFNNAQGLLGQGAQLGLQGQQAAQSGMAQYGSLANQLAGLGGQELAAKQGIIGTQAQQGQIEQTNQQNVINQAVQNYATAQQYPMLQLGMLNSMLRGLPMQQATTQMYQAAPSQVSQLAGLGTAGLGAAAMYNASKADGGVIKMAGGGSAVPMKMYSDQQLKSVETNPRSTPMSGLMAQGLLKERSQIQANPEAAKIMAQPLMAPQGGDMPPSGMPAPQQVAQMPQTRAGLGAIATGDMVPEKFANGGIMSYADGEDVKAPVTKGSKGELDYSAEIARRLANMDGDKDPFAGTKAEIADIKEEMKHRGAVNNAQALTRFGLGMLGGPSQYWQENVGKAGLNALNEYAKTGAADTADRRLLANTVRESEASKFQRENQNLNALIAAQSGIDAKRIGAANVAATREGNLALREATLISNASSAYTSAVKDSFKALAADEKNKFIFESNPGKLWDMARAEVYNSMPEQQRALLKLSDPTASAKNPPPANPNPAPPSASAPQPIIVTIPAKDGKPASQVAFDSPEKAAAFKKAIGI